MFKNLTEENLELLKKECQPYIKTLNQDNIKKILYRGTRYNSDFLRIKPRKNRRPLDSSKELHQTIDTLFKKQYNVKIRSEGVFCAVDDMLASNYGNVYYVFPIGDFSLYWSEEILDLQQIITIEESLNFAIHDKNIDFLTLCLYILKKSLGDEETKERLFEELEILDDEDKVDFWFDTCKKEEKRVLKEFVGKYYTKSNDIRDIKSYHTEIMLVCDEYYLVSEKIIKDTKEFIKSLKGN